MVMSIFMRLLLTSYDLYLFLFNKFCSSLNPHYQALYADARRSVVCISNEMWRFNLYVMIEWKDAGVHLYCHCFKWHILLVLRIYIWPRDIGSILYQYQREHQAKQTNQHISKSNACDEITNIMLWVNDITNFKEGFRRILYNTTDPCLVKWVLGCFLILN